MEVGEELGLAALDSVALLEIIKHLDGMVPILSSIDTTSFIAIV